MKDVKRERYCPFNLTLLPDVHTVALISRANKHIFTLHTRFLEMMVFSAV